MRKERFVHENDVTIPKNILPFAKTCSYLYVLLSLTFHFSGLVRGYFILLDLLASLQKE